MSDTVSRASSISERPGDPPGRGAASAAASSDTSPGVHREAAEPSGADRAARWVIPLAVTLGAAFAVAGLVDAVRERGDIAIVDPAVTADAISDRTPTLTVIAQVLTFMGSVIGVGALTLAAVAWLLWRRRRTEAMVVATTMAVSSGLTELLKHLIARPRPTADLVLGAPSASYSFPSGHTLNSTVLFGLLAGLVLLRVRSLGARVTAVAGWVVASVAVGASRVYLGYHWLTDVLGGWSVALALLGLVALVLPRLVSLRPRR